MADAVFHKRLNDQRRHEPLLAARLQVDLASDALAEAGLFDGQVGAHLVHFLGQAHEASRAVQVAAHVAGEVEQEFPGLARRGAAKRGDGVEGIEKEVRVDLGLEAADFGVGQQLVGDADVLQFELGGKKRGQALGQFEQGRVQGAVLGAVELEAAADFRALAQGHDNGLAQRTAGLGAADGFRIVEKKRLPGLDGLLRGPGAPVLAGAVVVLAGPDMGQDGGHARDGHGGHARLGQDDFRRGLGRLRGEAAAQMGHGLARDGEDAPRLGRIAQFAQPALHAERLDEDGRAHGVNDDHGRADDFDEVHGLGKGPRQGEHEAHVDGLAHDAKGHGHAPVQGLARIAPGDEPRGRALEERGQGAGQGRKPAHVDQVAVAAGDESGPDADHRAAEKPGRDHAHGAQVGVGMEDVVAGVGAEDAEDAKEDRDGERAPQGPFPSRAHALERGERHDGETAGEQQAEALGQVQEQVRHGGNEDVEVHGAPLLQPQAFLELAHAVAADRDFRALRVAEHEQVLAADPGREFGHALEVDQRGAVGAEKGQSGQTLLGPGQGWQAVAGKAPLVGQGVDALVVCLEAKDFRRGQKRDAAVALHGDARAGPAAAAAQPGQQRGHGLGLAGLSRGQPPPGALEAHGQTFGRDGLEQVIHGVLLEGGHGVLVKSGDEDEKGHVDAVHGLAQHVETVLAGHADVEEHEVGPVRLDGGQGRAGAVGFGDLDVGVGAEQVGELVASRLFVVHDQGAQLHGATVAPRPGPVKRREATRESCGIRRFFSARP
ncbi:hypothetical protein DSECCO2_572760 [anaerobic digester metagenome]